MKNFICFLLLVFLANSPARGEEETIRLKSYVENLISEGYNILNDKTLSEQDRVKHSSVLIESNLYLEWMAKYTLGRHRRALSEEQIKEFSAVYSKFVVKAYADLSRHYNGERAVIKKIKQIDDDMFIVGMEIVKPNASLPIKVEYLIHKIKKSKGTSYLVGDVIAEGISILNSQQSEFNSVISNQGIDALINSLKQKLEN